MSDNRTEAEKREDNLLIKQALDDATAQAKSAFDRLSANNHLSVERLASEIETVLPG